MKKYVISLICVFLIISFVFFAIENKDKLLTINEQNQWTMKLNEAIDIGDVDKVKVLLKNKKMDINKSGGSLIAYILFSTECPLRTPFETALYSNNLEMINLVLDYGAVPYADDNPIGWILCVTTDGTFQERFQCAKKMLMLDSWEDYYDYNDGVTLTNIAGVTPVNWKGEYSHQQAEQIKELYVLAKKKCNYEEDLDGNTVLHYATSYGRNLALIKYLVEECGYSVSVENKDKENPLMYMVKYYDANYDNDCNMKEIFSYYLDYGVDLNNKDKDDKTISYYLIENDIEHVIKS